MTNRRLVYSDDPRDVKQKCPRCMNFLDDCKCVRQESAAKDFTVIFRLEKSGRGGKTVTVMDGWPRNEEFLKATAKELKAKCGTGGTHNFDSTKATIEIQGDQRDKLKALLTAKGIRYKGM